MIPRSCRLASSALIAFILLPARLVHAQEPFPPSSASASAAVDDLSRFLPSEDLERDGRRTLGRFPRNLGRSFVGVFSQDNLVPFVAGVTATGAAWTLDSRAQSGLMGRAEGASRTASSVGHPRYLIPAGVALFAASRFAEGGRFRAYGYDLAQAMVVNGVYTNVLKHLGGRTRPDGTDQLSFPSGHTSVAFAWAAVTQAHYGWKAGLPSYLAASAVGLSRVTGNRHHLSDVLAGATIGVITGRTVARTNGEPLGRKKNFALHPVTDAQGTGVGLGASFTW